MAEPDPPRDGHTDTAPAAPSADLAPGLEIGGAVVEARVSSGGFGAVYRARRPEGLVALKVLHASLLGEGSAVQRFHREAEAIRRLVHPAIVRVLGHGDLPDGRPYLVLEWVGGRTLEAVLREQGRLPLDEVVAVTEQLASALAESHRERIVHRDLKASNVMAVVGPPGIEVKLLDFGIAKLLDDGTGLTGTHSLVGTPGYMAPEQIRGHTIGPAADVYALGVLLFHLATGRLPFQADSAVALLRLHLDEPPPRASDVAPVPEAFADVLLRCLAKHPADRYDVLDELVADLGAAARAPIPTGDGLGFDTLAAVALRIEIGDASAWPQGPEQLLARAREACARCAMSLAFEDERSLVAVAPLPASEAEARATRERVVGLALDLAAASAPAGAPQPASVEVHAAQVTRLVVDGTAQYVGGDLLSGDWPTRVLRRRQPTDDQLPTPVVLASDAVLAGLEERFASAPPEPSTFERSPTLRLVTARRPPAARGG